MNVAKETPEVIELTDVAAMRVLAHPTRLRLLGMLRTNGPQTAALLGEIVDEAPGTVSYHLGKLASVGLIEEAPEESADKRERWWRSRHQFTSWKPAELLNDPAGLAAATAMHRVIVQHYASLMNSYLDVLPELSPDWVAAAASSDHSLELTAAELAELRDELDQVVGKFQARSDQRGQSSETETVTVIYQAFRTP
ncbi:winged helix-turn-helix domain-containing protein [Psychromicrobium lacuslunae]|uniref:winged helix-turn-helix domain-containing protein n=1 Tax=Psychromicrobium lacuslunae TaxID=1618207 RepID=UPI0005D3F4BF|nr:helix-turn-helix domain-containing protein [Psychromicrobium lacuslunae]